VIIFKELVLELEKAPYSAIIPDIVPREQYGVASGWLGFMMMLGNTIGGSIGFFYDLFGGFKYLLYEILAVLIICSIITSCGFTRNLYTSKPIPRPLPNGCSEFSYSFLKNLVQPFQSPDFMWVFITRMFIGLGFNTVQQFAQYYITDVIPSPYSFFSILNFETDVKRATAFFGCMYFVGSVISTIIFGFLSDKLGKKVMVYISGVIMVIGIIPIALPVFNYYQFLILFGMVSGLGYGGYVSVDWALVCDVLPSSENYGKDMAIWHFSWTIPQLICPLLSGFLLDFFKNRFDNYLSNLGYWILWGSTILWFILGTIFIKNVRLSKIRDMNTLDSFFFKRIY